MRPTKLLPALLAALLGALLLAGCGDDDADDAVPATEPTTETTAGSGEAADDAVAIAGFAFGPDTLTVPSGTTVTWTNDDSTSHTVTADDDSFDSGSLADGATFEHTFDEAGTFAYHCEIHPTMTGEVVVEG